MLHLQFAMFLATPMPGLVDEPNGPIFHQWLPNGEEDAITFRFADPRSSLRVWFLRRGYLDRGLIRYASDRSEVDEGIMRRQGWLDAGPLLGEGSFPHVSAAELAAVRADARGAPDYIAIGKRVIDFLVPPLQAFVDTLRLQYGQYWLSELRPWDSRDATLGGYCQGKFHLKWRDEEAALWRPFLPNDPGQTVHMVPIPGRGYAEYLTKSDWAEIQSNVGSKPMLPLALRIAGRAHELSDSGFEAEAFIQATTALELALEFFISNRATAYGATGASSLATYSGLPLTQQLMLIAITTDRLTPETVNAACRAVETRNKIVHEASLPRTLDVGDLLALLKSVQILLGVPEFKSPRLVNHNMLAAPPTE